MTFIWAFIVAGLFCMLAQIIIDNTKFTPGHVTALFTVLGSILAFFGIYEWLVGVAGGGASTIISNFGYLLYTGAYQGYQAMGILGIFVGMMSKAGAAIVASIVFAFVLTIFFKPRD